MRAGKLRHKVRLQKLGPRIDDEMGGGPIPFVDVAEVHASIEPLSGREQLLAGQLEAELTHRIRTRFFNGVKPHWRIRLDDPLTGTHVYDIESIIDPESRHRELEMMCTELIDW
jgi:SPP1 family predicted phage head-tail adaptor